MILTKITTLEFLVAKRACKANPELNLTSVAVKHGRPKGEAQRPRGFCEARAEEFSLSYNKFCEAD
jgi:hypothetical protein